MRKIKKLWHNLLQKKSQLIIGVHLPVLLPLPNLGLIIVDEEHEVGYQEKNIQRLTLKKLRFCVRSSMASPLY